MNASLSKISTTVRNFARLQAIRTSFAIGSRLAPETTVRRAARLFCTPFKSSRSRALAAPTLGAREAVLEIDGTRITTYVWGDPHTQPYVLFAHGWSSHGTRIAPWVPPLQAAGYAVVTFDQAAHGKSDGTQTTLPDFACHLLAVGHHFGPAAAVIGHSLGGAATAVALANGLEAERAVLIAPPADPLVMADQFAGMIGMARHLSRRMFALFERSMRFAVEELQAQNLAPR
ncbi:MAG TPA: alpha/beta fold hydrolase, partial [Lysobacter sp.]|nr:alpha/beta fold hydrolase [Lysobacter sp.]